MSDEKFEQLKQELKRVGFTEIDRYDPPNIPERLLLIINYSPSDKKPPACFALSLENYYNGDNNFPNKCWMDFEKISCPHEECPNPYPGYKEFEHNGKKYHPFSIGTKECTAESIKELIRDLYAYKPK